ncbi:MAG: hypothetical protein Q7R34_04880 [Dehalococcoidia bacterium]|nr:hypothetical protein [Dehalococcoidia bacterium]
MVQEELTAKAKRIRSPAYPGITLEEALSKAEIIRKAEGKNEANVDTILAHWNYKPKSGGGLVVLSALLKFGLMTDSGSGANRKARLTDTALKILLDERPDSAERMAMIKEAALAPTIHKELWNKYQGCLPSDLNLRYYLRSEKNFLDDAADELIKEFRKTLDYAKLGESAFISPEGKDKSKSEGEIQVPNLLVDAKSESPQGLEKHADGQKQVTTPPTIKQIQIPLTGTTWAVVQVPVPMSEENWQELEDFLDLMKGGITGTRKQTTPRGKTNKG